MAHVGREKHVCFSLDGSVLDPTRGGVASLSMSVLLTDRSDPTAGRRELDAAKQAAIKLDPSECGNRAMVHLKSVVKKINTVKDMLDEASQVCSVSLCKTYYTDERSRRFIRSQASRGRSSHRS